MCVVVCEVLFLMCLVFFFLVFLLVVFGRLASGSMVAYEL